MPAPEGIDGPGREDRPLLTFENKPTGPDLDPSNPRPSFKLFSATTLMDFSYTFHNLMVLSRLE